MQDIVLFAQNHTTLSLSLVVVLILLLIVELIRLKRGSNQVTSAQTTQLINHQNGVVVDIRPSEAFASGHLVDAISIPFNEFEDKSKKLEKFKSRPIIIVCAGGTESARASLLLAKQGFNTFILSGGIRTWKQDDMPLVKG